MVTCARRAVEGLPYEFHSCDVRDDDAVKAMIDEVVDRHGRLDSSSTTPAARPMC